MSFRQISDSFIERTSKYKIVENPASVIYHVRNWTNGERDLTALILESIVTRTFAISNGEEDSRVREFVRSRVIENWRENDAASHLKQIEGTLFAYPNKKKVLLKLFSILSTESTQTDASPEENALIEASLVVDENGLLKIHNPIYQAIFNQDWIEQSLDNTPTATVAPAKQSSVGSWTTDAVKLFRSLDLRILLSVLAGFLFLTTIFFACQQEPKIRVVDEPGVDAPEEPLEPGDEDTADNPIENQISSGERVLIESEELSQENLSFRTAKKKGVDAITAGDYEGALIYFDEALLYYKNAPETLIYRNNARIETENEGKSYAIAAAVPISDDLPAAQGMLRGVAQAQNRINESGGINGVPLKVVIVDDGGDAEKAPELAALVGNESDVLGVVGHYYSSVTLSAAETYKQAQLPIIALSSSVEISTLGNDFIFRTSPSDAVVGKLLANHMLETWNQERVAVFYNASSAYSRSLKSAFQSTVLSEGGKVVADFDLSKNSFNVQEAFEQASERDAQVLMLVPSSLSELQEVVIPLADLNFTSGEQLSLMGGDVVYSDKVLTEQFEDSVVGAFWHISAADPNSEFIIQSQQLWNAEVNWVTAMAYDAAQAWIEALERSESDPTRMGLQTILSSKEELFSAPGASESVQFLESGDRPISGQLVQVVQQGNLDDSNYLFEAIAE